MKVTWSRGVVVFEGSERELSFVLSNFDGKRKGNKVFVLPLDWARGRESFLVSCPFRVEEKVFELLEPPEVFEKPPELREYQRSAVERWWDAGKRGTVVLPTGAGKTYVALEVIFRLRVPTLVVVPTLVLVSQWKDVLKRYFRDIGEWSGREKKLAGITVATYDSSALSAEILGNKFALLVFDEVHHLPSPTYRLVAEHSVAPFRLGLSATPERQDELHVLIDRLCGPVVFRATPEDFRGVWLADWNIVRIYVRLTPEEEREYRAHMEVWRNFLLARGLQPGTKEAFLRVVRMAGFDADARRALRALVVAKRIAFGTQSKLNAIRKLLERHKGQKIIIFTQFQDFARRISEEFLVPVILSGTPQSERKEYLEGFREGRYSVLVSAHVLDEGIDVPDASVGIIVSGTASSREFIQRLGRILRPTKRRAVLYELVSASTTERATSARRKSVLANSFGPDDF